MFFFYLTRFHQALEIEEKVVKCLKGLAPSELGFIHDVTKHLHVHGFFWDICYVGNPLVSMHLKSEFHAKNF